MAILKKNMAISGGSDLKSMDEWKNFKTYLLLNHKIEKKKFEYHSNKM